MKTIKIHTWKCACGYSQDFDPMDEAKVREVFHNDKQGNFSTLACGDCPCCHLEGQKSPLPKAIAETDMMVMNVLEAADVIRIRSELESEGPRKVSTGFKEVRQETEGEKVKRIELALEGKPEVLKGVLQVELEKSPLLTREFDIHRDELPEEMAYRIDQELSRLKPATPEEVQALCEKYECK